MIVRGRQKMFIRTMILGSAMAVSVLAGACDTLVYDGNPTHLTAGKAETYRDHYAVEAETAAIGPDAVTQISRDYWSRGETPLQVAVTYDPHSPSNTAMKATQQMTRIATALRAKGVKNIEADILPVQESGDVSKTLISFETVEARPPSECSDVLDMDFADQERAEDYALGCTVETYLARQVARPKDLNGRDTMDNPDGRKTHNALGPYRGGGPNPDLSGESASE